jgi:hypothetical protein
MLLHTVVLQKLFIPYHSSFKPGQRLRLRCQNNNKQQQPGTAKQKLILLILSPWL